MELLGFDRKPGHRTGTSTPNSNGFHPPFAEARRSTKILAVRPCAMAYRRLRAFIDMVVATFPDGREPVVSVRGKARGALR